MDNVVLPLGVHKVCSIVRFLMVLLQYYTENVGCFPRTALQKSLILKCSGILIQNVLSGLYSNSN